MGLAIAFAMVVLIALLIGVKLTRKITYSVANLYKATQHINRGDFTHRIQVREKDQLAALQVSFNSMTDNLERLIAEQKEKERLQSELEIAHEVQAQLFPAPTSVPAPWSCMASAGPHASSAVITTTSSPTVRSRWRLPWAT